ncbi:histidine phosphatase family protein [Pseudooceanicola sp.]|uniref:SixA phosphatase family protein n=1 Tax=Pseudooceanicola sp. TaxID=1914328 RepID=UPI0026057118|nr:histidine phosphatase family protein [Pseudooceanicola sp.]MDF1856940.1 histidine phosphatase family protein [Pseudooceanicola sp.]
MTKRLILIRHAKSSWAEPGIDDHDRPLNSRGRRSASAIGAWLRKMGYQPDLVLCSTALRTRETCDLLALEAKVMHLPALYLAEAEAILSALQAATGKTLALIGHNPGIGDFATRILTETPPHGRFADYPTGATLVADLATDKWRNLDFASGRMVNFITPRELTGD